MEKLLLVFSIFFRVLVASNSKIITLLTEEAEKIPKSKLIDAFTVTQYNYDDNSMYIMPVNNGSIWPHFFTANDKQMNNSVIVLHKAEDGLDTCGKETYLHVVLILKEKEAENRTFSVLYAYRRSIGSKNTTDIEWESFSPRGGSTITKASFFGHVHCTRSLLTSCKIKKPDSNFAKYRNIKKRSNHTKLTDYYCDILNDKGIDDHIAGSILATMNMAESISTAAKIINDYAIKNSESSTDNATNYFIAEGNKAIGTGVLGCYIAIAGIGQIAEQLIKTEKEMWDSFHKPGFEAMRTRMTRKLGRRFLFDLMEGNNDFTQNTSSPAEEVFYDQIGRQVFGKKENDDSSDVIKTSRKGTISRAIDNLNSVLTKITHTKSAGGHFLENLNFEPYIYVPLGIIQNAIEKIGEYIGDGKINDILSQIGLDRLSQLFSGLVKNAYGRQLGVSVCNGVCGINQIMRYEAKKLEARGGVPEVITQEPIPGIPINMETELDLFATWGWLSQGIAMQNLSEENNTEDNFIGLGPLPIEGQTTKIADLEGINTSNNYIDFLIRLLRINNRKELPGQIANLITNNHVTYDQDNKTFALQEKSTLLTDKILTSEEEIDLYLTFELVSFSKSYKYLADSSLTLECPTGETISKSVALLQIMTMEYISMTYQFGIVHLVKLVRNYGMTLKTVFTKSLQDLYRYNSCKKCSPDQISLADNNAITLNGLFYFTSVRSWKIQYWTEETPNSEKFHVQSITKYYSTYFSENRKNFTSFVSKYII